LKPNGLAFDSDRGLLVAANVGDPQIPGSHTVSVVDVERRKRVADVDVPGRTRWCIFDPVRDRFFINIASPARIVAIDPCEPTHITRQYEVSAAGPHGLDLDPVSARLLCACDAGVLVALEASSGRIFGEVSLSGPPDVVFLQPQSRRLYVAIGEPGVIDVVDVDAMRRIEVVPTESGAHTLALDQKRNTVYAFLPGSHRAQVFIEKP
jgi:DNA-binding beta-propeller fold protein YncE